MHRTRGERLRLQFDGAPTLGLWARPGAPFICIEPWWGRDDDAAAPHASVEKAQLQKLAVGAVFEGRMKISPAKEVLIYRDTPDGRRGLLAR